MTGDGGRIRLVIADDHPAIVDAVSRFLEVDADLELVGTAADGNAALRIIEAERPDIALVDVRMPGLGGIDVARRLAETGAPTAVVLYTAFAERAILLEALDAGARGFVLKEAPLDDLARAVRIVAAGESYVDAALVTLLAGPDAAPRLPMLTRRERDVLRLLASGMRDEQVGRTLSISPLTVRSHVQHAMAKLQSDTRTQAVAIALRQSLIT